MKNNYSEVNTVTISRDFKTGERCGAGGTFQVVSIILETDNDEIDVTDKIDQGKHYYSGEEVVKDLGIDSDVNIDYDDEVYAGQD